jgi:hypothetical protein
LYIRILRWDELYIFRDDGRTPTQRARQIAALKDRHRSLFLLPKVEPDDDDDEHLEALPPGVEDEISVEDEIIGYVASIVGKEGPGPKNLVVVAGTWGDLFDPASGSPPLTFLVFDDRGELVADASEAELRDRRGTQIDVLKERLGPLWNRPEQLTWEDEQRIIKDIASILGRKSIWEPTTKTNPFDGHAEVRVIKVRPWVLGVKTSNEKCHVDLNHMGNEVFRREDGAIVELTHKPVEGIGFSYDWSKVLWNFKGGSVEKPALSLEHESMDGDLILQGKYADWDNIPLIGPFAKWEIKIEKGKHTGLDRSKISAICLDFHILSKSITTGPLLWPPT